MGTDTCATMRVQYYSQIWRFNDSFEEPLSRYLFIYSSGNSYLFIYSNGNSFKKHLIFGDIYLLIQYEIHLRNILFSMIYVCFSYCCSTRN
ncbi:unnamed protein product [Rotaria magnacalcarata]